MKKITKLFISLGLATSLSLTTAWLFKSIIKPVAAQSPTPRVLTCGEIFSEVGNNICQCSGVPNDGHWFKSSGLGGVGIRCCGTVSNNTCLDPNNPNPPAKIHSCGDIFPDDPVHGCQCPGIPPEGYLLKKRLIGKNRQCCGVVSGKYCFAPQPTTQPHGTNPPDPVTDPITKDRFSQFNPLVQESKNALSKNPLINTDGSLNTAGTINRVLVFLFPLSGMILFVMLVWGGFEMLTGAASKKSLDAGKQRITAALIGFILLFSSYWFIQIIQAITGVSILN